MPVYRSRLAPTPSGFLHTGNAFSFLLTWLMVRKTDGDLLLRIDDIDAERKRTEYVQDIFDSIKWLGIDCDRGPKNVADFETQWSQHLRLENYRKWIGTISDHCFACTCSRAMIGNGVYPGICLGKNIPFDTPQSALRMNVQPGERIGIDDVFRGKLKYEVGREMGCFVVRKKDGLPAYQIASLADDVQYNINFIVRGEDLLPSTAAQLFIAQKANAQSFTETRFLHHPLIINTDGTKLSKSAGALALRTMRENGESVSKIYTAFSSWMKLPRSCSTLQELYEQFDPSQFRFA